eukprot:7724092-Pyramimonas_sp.AAC.1
MHESRSPVGFPDTLFKRRALDNQESRSRFGLSRELHGIRAIARDVLAMHAGRTLQQPAWSIWP